MIHNPVIDAMLNRKSVRTFTDEQPSDEIVQTLVAVGQQAPFAYQLGSMILDRSRKNPFKAPLFFLICYDMHRMALVAAKRGWEIAVDDLQLMTFGFQDAAYMAQNMVIAAESLGLASCYLGVYPFIAPTLKKKFKLPDRVFPVVGLVIGYPDPLEAEFTPRPRYPMAFTCFEDSYPEFTDCDVESAMQVMDDGYLAQGYYARQKVMIPLRGEKDETFTFDNYSWTEHISRKCALYTDMNLRAAYEKIGFIMPDSGSVLEDIDMDED